MGYLYYGLPCRYFCIEALCSWRSPESPEESLSREVSENVNAAKQIISVHAIKGKILKSSSFRAMILLVYLHV